ncbi:proteasomal ubiquitin receptor ADRM1-like [Coccinella septempunctata]|uniref:proteasomal ubiquitin receptor ADRM1-like n=1 Tax=Coccinella septempunctata TaxID=41139 RepID=UPI001D077314|nr:proteasomal ubiquitin receptor ADRM1-like [Coccinella septempunctata]
MSSSGALFPNVPTALGYRSGVKHVVEMRAGKMELRGRMIYPDKRKGLIYVFQSEDSLMHFCWQDRTTGTVEEDLIIFPDDCEYVRIPQCTTGRAYVLKFRTSNRRFFFWLQEPKTDKDDEHCKRINEILNNPASINSSENPNSDHDLQSLLSSMSQSQLIQLFGGSGQMGPLSSLLGTIRGPGSARTSTTPAITHRTVPSTPTTATNTQSSPVTSANLSTPQNASTTIATPDAPKRNTSAPTETAPSTLQPIQLSDLQNFLQNITPAAPQQQQSVDLSTALTTDALSGVLSSPEALQQLQSHLPPVEGSTPQEALRTTVASPQFQNAVSQFSSALETGMLGPVVSQLSVNSEAVAAASQGNMQEFVKALEKSTADSGDAKKEDKQENTKDDKDDEKMQLD